MTPIVLICALNATTAHSQDALMATCKGTNVERSIPACTQILEANPSPDIAELAYQSRAFRLMTKGYFEKAVADLSEALRIRPDFYGLLTERANSYTRLGKFDLATADFEAALRLKPGFALAYAARSTMDFLMGDINKTISDASEAVRLDPKLFSAYSNRGSARREKGDFESALTDLNIAIRLSPYTSRPLYQRGLTYFRKGDLQSALSDYEAAINLNPQEKDAIQGRDVVKGMLLSRSGKQPEQATVQGSRDPTAGTVWKIFEAKKAGVSLLVEEAKNPAERFTFEENGDWIDRRPPSNGTSIPATHFIHVLTKPRDLPVDQAIRQAFVDPLPPEAKAGCQVRPLVDFPAAAPGKQLFEIAPVGRYADKIDAKLRDNPPLSQADGGCGDYGIGAATSYFEYRPAESSEKYLYIFAGFDMGFDEKSIKILSTGSAPSALGAKPARPEAPHNLATQIWSVSLGQDPSGTLFCEAVARGQNPAAGGDYSIRYRLETPQRARMIVTYAKPRMEYAETIVTLLDDHPLGSYPAKQIMFGNENALVATIDAGSFRDRALKAFETPEAFMFHIQAGLRTFDAPVTGYADVNANLDACMNRLTKRP